MAAPLGTRHREWCWRPPLRLLLGLAFLALLLGSGGWQQSPADPPAAMVTTTLDVQQGDAVRVSDGQPADAAARATDAGVLDPTDRPAAAPGGDARSSIAPSSGPRPHHRVGPAGRATCSPLGERAPPLRV